MMNTVWKSIRQEVVSAKIARHKVSWFVKRPVKERRIQNEGKEEARN